MAQQPLWAKAYGAHTRSRDRGPWGANQMSRLGGQSNAGPPSVQFPRMLGPQFYRPTEGMKGLSPPCPIRGQNLEPVVWECEALPLRHRASNFWS